MIVQINYQIQFQNDNILEGHISSKVGQNLILLKRRICELQNIKNQSTFRIISGSITTIKQSISGVQNRVTSQTHKILLRQQTPKSTISIKSRKMSQQSLYQQSSFVTQSHPFDNFIQIQPQIPPIVCGYVTFPNSFFFCFSTRKYLRLDSMGLKFFNSQMGQVETQIRIQQVIEIQSYKRKHFYCVRILEINNTINMKFINKDVCREWVGHLRKVLAFSNYLKQKKAYSNTQSFKKFVDTFLNTKNNLDSTNIIKLSDDQQTVIDSVHQNLPCQSLTKRSSKSIIKLSSFQITHKIDSGSFSTIYLALHAKKLVVALKQLPKQTLLYKGQMKYALTQLSILSKSSPCPYIIPLYYAFQTHEYLYLALKYIKNGNLSKFIQVRKKVKQDQAIRLIAELVVAIQYLHSKKVLYRDLKPDNILIDETGHLYLTDFGLAKQLTEQQEQAHSFLGTPLYLAPERFMENGGGIDFKSDIYAMLHGYHPFSADNFNSVVYNIKNIDIQIEEQISIQAKSFLLESLQKNPSKRLSKMSQHLLFRKLDWKKILSKQHQGVKLEKYVQREKIQITYQIDSDYNQDTYPDRKISGWNYNYEQKQAWPVTYCLKSSTKQKAQKSQKES